MKILGIAGSPRRNGNTDILLAELLKGAVSKGADVQTIYLNKLKITPCEHCDACLKTGKCRIQDDMQQIYNELEQADVIVLASPVQFSGPPALVKAMIDRCQLYWARRFVLKTDSGRQHPGGNFLALLVGGTEYKTLFDAPRLVLGAWCVTMELELQMGLTLRKIDHKKAIQEHPEALVRARELGRTVGDPLRRSERGRGGRV